MATAATRVIAKVARSLAKDEAELGATRKPLPCGGTTCTETAEKVIHPCGDPTCNVVNARHRDQVTPKPEAKRRVRAIREKLECGAKAPATEGDHG